jgi:hypothetical protein
MLPAAQQSFRTTILFTKKITMENYQIAEDISAMGFAVTTFPIGVGEAFAKLMKTIPDPRGRPYYGIGECTPNGIRYIAAVLQNYDGEASQYGYNKYTIEKGDYLAEIVTDWQSKTDSIKNVFDEMYKDGRADRNKPSIEIYKDMQEMICLVATNSKTQLSDTFNEVTDELVGLLASLGHEQINKVPFEGSWTAGQLARHIIKSDEGFATMLHGPDKDTDRKPDEKVAQIRTMFLNFNIKMKSPEFVRPEIIDYDKEVVLQSLKKAQASITDAVQTKDLAKTCTAFEVPTIGALTRLEAINFVIYHTKRHVHQLTKIKQSLK